MSDFQKHIRSCFKRVLTPVVRFAIRYSITFQEFQQYLKLIYVEEAKKHLKSSGSKVNVMRVSAATGIRREVVMKYFDSETIPDATRGVAGRVISRWLQDNEFLNSQGLPKVLSVKGSDSDFHKLVQTISKDISPKSLLTHYLANNIIEETSRGVKLVKGGYIMPANFSEESVGMLESDLNDLIVCVEENIFHSPIKPNLHLTTEYDEICVEDDEEIRAWLLKEGTRFHNRLTRFLTKYDRSFNRGTSEESKPSKSEKTIVVGTFSRIFNSQSNCNNSNYD